MKLALSLIMILIFGCSPETHSIKSIEIMSYYYQADENFRPNPKYILYSYIDPTGNVETLLKQDEKVAAYELSSEPQALQKLIQKISTTTDTIFDYKIPNTTLYCGPTTRYKIIYDNNDVKTFAFAYIPKKSQLKYFKNFVEIIRKDSAKGKAVSKNRHMNLEKKRVAYTQFVIHCDTLKNPFPPRPKAVNTVKFVGK